MKERPTKRKKDGRRDQGIENERPATKPLVGAQTDWLLVGKTGNTLPLAYYDKTLSYVVGREEKSS